MWPREINVRLTSDFFEPFTPTHILDLSEPPGGCGLGQGKNQELDLYFTVKHGK